MRSKSSESKPLSMMTQWLPQRVLLLPTVFIKVALHEEPGGKEHKKTVH
jgi:hypothetical protein